MIRPIVLWYSVDKQVPLMSDRQIQTRATNAGFFVPKEIPHGQETTEKTLQTLETPPLLILPINTLGCGKIE
jgi:hypothetical protein